MPLAWKSQRELEDLSMITLNCWLPEKEMFGRFSLVSLSAAGDVLEAVVSNEVFQFVIRFPRGVGACRVTEAARAAERLAICGVIPSSSSAVVHLRTSAAGKGTYIILLRPQTTWWISCRMPHLPFSFPGLKRPEHSQFGQCEQTPCPSGGGAFYSLLG